MKKIIILLLLSASQTDAQVYIGAGAGYSFNKSTPVAELQIGISENNIVVQGGFLAHFDSKTPVLLNIQAGGRIYTQESAGWQLTAGYCYQYMSNDVKSRNKKTFIVSAQMFRPFGWGQWYVSGSYTPGYYTALIGVRGIFN